MKKILVLGMLITSVTSNASTVYSFYEGHENHPTADYFYVTSFAKDINHCYVRTTENVCEDIKNGEALTMDRYLDGAHDYFEIISCTHDHDQYTVKTKLFDDYGTNGEELVSVFGQCN
jgi:hypothetical protein